jgi:Uma2 family endonuclease
MGQAAVRTKLSPQEYLDLERAAEQRHEYADGEIFAMAGGTLEHSAVAANLLGELRNALLGRGCRVLSSDMRIKIAATGRYLYPDASVLCGRPEFEDTTRDTLLNPTAIVEVLSDSTEAYDRGDKFAQYRTIPSLREYVLSSQKEPRVEVFTRQPDGSWILRIYGAGARAALGSIGCEIEVDRLYLEVFDAQDATEGAAAPR